VVNTFDTEPKTNFVDLPVIDGDIITFTRPLTPKGQSQWRDVSDLDSTLSISYAVGESAWPSYHDARGVAKVQLSSTDESSVIFGGSMGFRSNIFLLHGVLMLVFFGVLVPIGIYLAKFYRLDYHKILMQLVFTNTVITALTALVINSGTDIPLSNHGIIGIVMLLIMTSLVASGIISSRYELLFFTTQDCQRPLRNLLPSLPPVHGFSSSPTGLTTNLPRC
jgi:hypothetical protein